MAPRKKAVVPPIAPIDTSTSAQPAPNAAEAATEPVAGPAKASKTEVTVKFRDHKGEPTERTFSQEVHGDDFAKLADEFKATNASRLIAE